MQPQTEVRESLAKVSQEPFGVITVLETHDEVVRVAHHDHIAARVTASPLVDP